MFGATCAIMHSKTPICVPITPPTTFWKRLDSYGNCSLWENLSYNRDGEWIQDRLRVGHSGISTQKRGTDRHLRKTTHYRENVRLKNRQPAWAEPRGRE
jgi:hypothetical protein